VSATFGRVGFTRHTRIHGFAAHLREGRLMGSRCDACGHVEFPPRADCPTCLEDGFTFVERKNRGTVVTYTRIDAAPAGFEDLAPYVLGVVDLEEGGRLLAWFGESLPEEALRIGLEVLVSPREIVLGDEVRVDYTLERLPGGKETP